MTTRTDDIVLVQADDWEGLYVGGKLIHEDHSIAADDLLVILFKAMLLRTEAHSEWCDDAWLSERGRLPKDIAEVQW